MTHEHMRLHIMQVVLTRLDLDPARRAEALHDFLTLNLPGMDESSIKAAAALVPSLPQTLYEKWINLFIDRLFETIPQIQLEELCDGTQDNNATLGLVYLMFMESARMEKQVEQDLSELGIKNSGHDAASDALSAYLKARLAQKKG